MDQIEEKIKTEENLDRRGGHGMAKGFIGCLVVFVLVIAAIVFGIKSCLSSSQLSTEVDQSIGLTPSQIASIKAIGQWEFLAINDEELVDTVRKGFFSDDELMRIYYGTLRLGIDLSKLKPGWAKRQGDSIRITLPPVELLDENFIDEARTQSFYESGKWSAGDREVLYLRAQQRMRYRCLNSSNMKSAEQNASKQMYQLMRSLGFNNVFIRFEEPVLENKKK